MCEICQDKTNGVGQLGNLQVKVCGLTNVADAIRAESAGANYGGMILSQGFGRSISLETVTKIVSAIKMPVVPVLVNEDIDTAEHLSRTAKATVIQLHGKETSAYVQSAEEGERRRWLVERCGCRHLLLSCRASSKYQIPDVTACRPCFAPVLFFIRRCSVDGEWSFNCGGRQGCSEESW